jgi:hypothetical protein
MVTVEKTNLMASTWTKAVLVRRAFNAGPKRKSDRVLDAEEATLEAYMAFRAFRNEAAKSGLGSAARLGLMLMDTKCKGRDEIMGVPTKLENIAELFAKVKKATKGGEDSKRRQLGWRGSRDAYPGCHMGEALARGKPACPPSNRSGPSRF